MNTPLGKLEFDDLLNAIRKLVNYFDLQNLIALYDDDFSIDTLNHLYNLLQDGKDFEMAGLTDEETIILLSAFVEYLDEDIDHLLNVHSEASHTESGVARYNIITLGKNDLDIFRKLYDEWALTFEGLWPDDIEKVVDYLIKSDTSIESVNVYITLGEVMNHICKLTGRNAYPNDLNIISFLPFGRVLAMTIDARWFTDIVDNNADREGFHPLNDEYFDDESEERWTEAYGSGSSNVIMLRRTSDFPSEEIRKVSKMWTDLANSYGDVGPCVIGAGFEFDYNGQAYFLPPLSRWQGSISWEHWKDKIQRELENVGATNVRYDWGTMD